MLRIKFLNASCEIALTYVPQNPIDDKSHGAKSRLVTEILSGNLTEILVATCRH